MHNARKVSGRKRRNYHQNVEMHSSWPFVLRTFECANLLGPTKLFLIRKEHMDTALSQPR